MTLARVHLWRAWDIFIATCAVVVALYVPYELVHAGDDPALRALELAATVIFGIDVVVRYRRRDQPPVAGAPPASHHATTRWLGLALDLLAAVPMFLLTGATSWLWLRPLKLVRVAQMISLLRRHEIRNTTLIRMAAFLFWLGIATHWIACGWIALTDFVPTEGSRYIAALYWTVTTLTTVGYGDVVPHTDVQRIYTMCVMVLGVGMYGFVIGNIATILVNIDPVRAGQLRRMEKLSAFMRYRRLPKNLQERVSDYYRYLWQHQLDHDETEILRRLPPSLRTELGLHLKRDLLNAVPFFRNAGEAFLREVALGMQPAIFLPGDVILRAGERGRGMYFITRGKVEILSADQRTRLATLGEGDFFGEMALVFDEPRSATARAQDYCDLYQLDRDAFQRLLAVHPGVAELITQHAHERRQANIAAGKAALGSA